MFDVVIKGGTIIDGTGNKSFRADIGIVGEKIAKIGDIDSSHAVLSIDAAGKYVTPGFIDTHSHADTSAFLFPDCQSYLKQGITTFIGGTCGDSNAPLNNYWMRKYWEYDMWHEIDPFIFYPETIQPVERVKKVVFDKTGVMIDWNTFGEYLSKLEHIGIGTNMVTMLGHSQLRADVMGRAGDRRPTEIEMEKMRLHISEAMENGAWGISFGRDYPPSAYADEEEMLELLKQVKKYDGMFSIHWRRTGIRNDRAGRPNKLEGMEEALSLAYKAEMKVQVSHLDTGFEIYPSNGEIDIIAAKETLKIFDRYLEMGVDAAFDVIPGTSGGIVHVPYLVGYFMPWLKQAGSLSNFISCLKANDYRNELVNKIYAGHWYSINPNIDPEWDLKMIVEKCEESIYQDLSIREIADSMGIDSVRAVLMLLLADQTTMVHKHAKSIEAVRELLRHDRASVCTDTFSFDEKGIYGLDSEIPELLPHPHTYCAFPKYILESGLDSIESTIRKITGFPAEFTGLLGRGIIKEGYYADILIFDMKNLKTNENYQEPRKYAEGIEYAFVNGVLAIENRQLTGKKSGKILKNKHCV